MSFLCHYIISSCHQMQGILAHFAIKICLYFGAKSKSIENMVVLWIFNGTFNLTICEIHSSSWMFKRVWLWVRVVSIWLYGYSGAYMCVEDRIERAIMIIIANISISQYLSFCISQLTSAITVHVIMFQFVFGSLPLCVSFIKCIYSM